MKFEKPVVVVSKCLGFDACRYNGQVIEDKFLRKLAPHAKFLQVCPEVEIGLGVPRDPIRLVSAGQGVKLVQPDSGKDVTDEMERFAGRYVSSLADVDGFVLKSRSPSCGITDAKVYPSLMKGPSASKGPGVFARKVLESFPHAAIEDEGRLNNFRLREHFLTKLFLGARLRRLKKKPSMRALVQFQAEHKLLLMAYNQKEMRLLGRIVANHEKRTSSEVLALYESHLHNALARPGRYTSHINVLMHAMGYFSRQLNPREKAHFLDLLELYRQGKIPLSAAISVIRSWIHRFGTDYLEAQVYFEPYPPELVEITDSGKGRGKL
jgi:uncharacterized protein YbgA (DUF1722 family)/uncharacterized protein YbbK (DUF523 family)